MSNQVFSNRFGAGTRYLPRNSEKDVFTLIKNNPAVGPVSAYGAQLKLAPATGVGLFFNKLNGNDTVNVGGIENYRLYQTPETKQYWTLASTNTIQSGATLLYSLVDNVISINSCLPVDLPSNGAGPHKLCLMARVFNSDFTVDYNAALISDAQFPGLTQPHPWSVNAVVRVKTGQILGIYAVAENKTVEYKDDLFGTNNIQMECRVEFAKM